MIVQYFDAVHDIMMVKQLQASDLSQASEIDTLTLSIRFFIDLHSYIL